MRRDMGLLSIVLLAAMAFGGCRGRSGELRIRGEIDNLDQGEFLLYTTDGDLTGIDTLHIVGGQIDYTTPLSHDAEYYILYPNYSQQVIFASSGDVITLQGDAQSLSTISIQGGEDNEDFTLMRQQNTTADELRQAARQYISQHPDRRLSTYLFRQYFITDRALYDTLCAAQPDARALISLQDALRSQDALKKGTKLPDFTLQTRSGDTIHTRDYQGKYLFITFWANWRGGGGGFHYRIRQRLRSHPQQYAAISYSLEVDARMQDYTERMDSITWASCFDQQGFDSPLVRKLGIRDIPYCVVIDPQQRILGHGSDFARDIEPLLP